MYKEKKKKYGGWSFKPNETVVRRTDMVDGNFNRLKLYFCLSIGSQSVNIVDKSNLSSTWVCLYS
jgi:hypothetical protein